MSRSPTVVRRRRRLPAAVTIRACGQLLQRGDDLLGHRQRLAQRIAIAAAGASASMPCRMFSSDLAPRPGRLRMAGCAPPASRPATSVMPSFSYSSRAVLGPTPGTASSVSSSPGMSAVTLVQQAAGGRCSESRRSSSRWPRPRPGWSRSLPSRHRSVTLARLVVDVLGGPAVGNDLVDHLALDLQQIGQLGEHRRHLGVAHYGICHRMSSLFLTPTSSPI